MHEERKLEDIKEIINSIDISDKVKSDAINIYMLIDILITDRGYKNKKILGGFINVKNK